MTLENLKKANELYKQINQKKEFIKAFEYPALNTIIAYDLSDGSETQRVFSLSDEPDLSDIIRDYISNQIERLEKRMEEL